MGGTLGPLGFLTGIVLGTAASISIVLLMVLAVFALSSVPADSLGSEPGGLFLTVALFGGLAVVSALAFLGLQKRLAWRWWAQGAMWASLVALAWYYWPAGSN